MPFHGDERGPTTGFCRLRTAPTFDLEARSVACCPGALGTMLIEAGQKALAANAQMRRLIDQSAQKYIDEDGITRLTWHPDLERIRPVVVKNARGHAFFELGLPFYHEPTHIIIQPLITAPEEWLSAFLTIDHGNGWPEVGSRLLQRLVSGEDMASGWIIVQLGTYVFAVFEDDDGVIVRSIIREYLLTEVRWDHNS